MKPSYHYYMFHKPAGCVTARRDDRYPCVLDYFAREALSELTHVGRLDRETEGLLLLTDDGSWCHQLLHPSMDKEKEYEFLVLGDLTEQAIHRLEAGIILGKTDKATAPARITVTGSYRMEEVLDQLYPEVRVKISKNRPGTPVTAGRIIITEGRKNQIRRMMKQAGVFCIRLKRIRIADIYLDPELAPGSYRELTEKEVQL